MAMKGASITFPLPGLSLPRQFSPLDCSVLSVDSVISGHWIPVKIEKGLQTEIKMGLEVFTGLRLKEPRLNYVLV